jgi:hypothetical protein
MLGIFGGTRSDHPMADLKEAKRLLAALPVSDAGEALEEVTHWLQSVTGEPSFTPERRAELVQLVDEAGQPLARKVGRDYLGSSRIGKHQEARLWTVVHGFWKASALAYVTCLDAFATGQKGADALKGSVPLLGVRALRALATQLKWLHVRYGPLDDAIWMMINRTYAMLESRKLARSKVTVFPGVAAESTAEHEFMRVVMFHACSPDSLLPQEIEVAERVIANWAPRFTLAREHQPDTPYWIDLGATVSPVRIARPPQPSAWLRFFGAGAAFAELDQLVQEIRKTREFPASLGVGESVTAEAALGVLEHLQACWSPKPAERRHPRHRVKSRLTIAWGFDGILQMLAPGDSLTFDGSTCESWIVENVSVGGFGALVPEVRGDWLRIGCLLAMQPEGGDNWLIGVVRRLSRPSMQKAAVGIQTLARSAVPVTLRLHIGNRTSLDVETGILLNPTAPDGEVHVLVRAGVHAPGQSLSFDLNGRHVVLLPVGVPERRSDYELLRCRHLVRDAA